MWTLTCPPLLSSARNKEDTAHHHHRTGSPAREISVRNITGPYAMIITLSRKNRPASEQSRYRTLVRNKKRLAGENHVRSKRALQRTTESNGWGMQSQDTHTDASKANLNHNPNHVTCDDITVSSLCQITRSCSGFDQQKVYFVTVPVVRNRTRSPIETTLVKNATDSLSKTLESQETRCELLGSINQ